MLNVFPRFGEERFPLSLACSRADVGLVAELLAGGEDPNEKTEFGNTPLHKAARSGNAPCVEALLAAGAHWNARYAYLF